MINNSITFEKYPNPIQEEAAQLVYSARDVAGWKQVYYSEALNLAADRLDKQISIHNSETQNNVLKAIAAYYREEARHD